MRVLVVEDEQKVANALREGLEGERYDVVVERTGEDAFFRMTTEAFDLILLDLGLPGRDGLEILTTLRNKGIKTPVLVLTARDTLQDRVAGLDSGADDYLVKPFAFAELLAVDATSAQLRESAESDTGLFRAMLRWDRLQIGETFAPENQALSGRTVADQVTLFKSVGCALEDLVAAELLL